MLNPDAIFDGLRFWSEDLRALRAQTYGIETPELPDYYRNRTLLKTCRRRGRGSPLLRWPALRENYRRHAAGGWGE